MTARIAVLVLAHRTAPLHALLRVLDARFRVFVHMDAKADWPAMRLPPHASLVEPRIEVFWGGWSMMQATLSLLDAARAAGGFRRYVLVSGDALPVVPLDRLEAALLDEAREFVDLVEVPDDPALAGMAVAAATERHGWVQPWRRYNPTAWDHRLLNPFQRDAAARHYGVAQDRIDWIRGDVERLLRDVLAQLRPPCPFPRFWYGAQWWALTADTVEAIRPAAARPEVVRFFRYIQVPDEHLIQTILGNTPAALGGRRAVGTPMWTDHARRAQGTDTLDRAGFRTAAARGPQILFARKFDPDKAPDIAAAIAAGRYAEEVLAGG
ncbi:beta-1,6-N-acetylglucosaminyltransferase [Limobrevibacterium gyesilva]|uniref:Beta-1,6-N-acetylglucosaminyltransferase n=1 Tax=Limobrevibacterium gyesilva TaxID=2991712 RepID=A0AA42CKH1_9PROT|nr:beta-1,6-N-acetylglucosaminyltransferase [Limobrevibacterium gyesilva]MCW3477902.1 beta-1,6-N-acetylglucosaminyltransferase [Limobrevibacterium gyesilva]